MPGLVAISVLFVLFVLIALPGVAAAARSKASVIAAPFYLVLLAAIFLHYGGLSFGGSLPATAMQTGAPVGLCEQALDQSQQAGLILDRTNPNRVRVDGALWEQLPQQAKDGLVRCLEGARPAGSDQIPVEIVGAAA